MIQELLRSRCYSNDFDQALRKILESSRAGKEHRDCSRMLSSMLHAMLEYTRVLRIRESGDLGAFEQLAESRRCKRSYGVPTLTMFTL